VLVGALQKIEGVRINMPKGAFYFVADLPVDDAEKFALFMLRDFSYKGATVMFAPAEDFYWTSGLGKSQARFAYVLNEDDLLLAAECIKEGLKVYRHKVMHQ
jgi:aspartate aminotransferase